MYWDKQLMKYDPCSMCEPGKIQSKNSLNNTPLTLTNCIIISLMIRQGSIYNNSHNLKPDAKAYVTFKCWFFRGLKTTV